MEASPSPVYGAALLMRFGFNAHREFKSRRLRHLSGASQWGAPDAFPTYGASLPKGGSEARPDACRLSDGRSRPCARSSTDRALDYGSRGYRFESCRAHSVKSRDIRMG